jgi:phosphate transport system protein
MSMQVSEHTTSAFDADLQKLVQLIAEMGGQVEKQFADSIDALLRHDRSRAEQVVARDGAIDALQQEIEERAVATIATRQPMAVDLRDIVGILRIAGELERVGDLAKNIGKRVVTLNGTEIPRKALSGVKHIANLAQKQLGDVLDSFANRDIPKALGVWTRDEEIDAMYTSMFRELLTYMMEDPGLMTFGIHLLFCAKNIERIGDHATNIAESICYMVEGHSFSENRPKADMTPGIGSRFAH